MGKKVFRFTPKRISRLADEMRELKFDCIIIIEGARGLGKSTLAYKICNLASKYHNFNPWKDIMYTREQIIDAFNDRWHSTFMADEMINVSFNRDFYNQDQKKLVKIINMNRDHCNLFVACVPSFATLDNQIRNMCKIKITVVKRGIGLVQTPNRTIYSRDKWDTAYNEKIERAWLEKNATRPQYSRLTTFRGYIFFSDLTPKQREEYEQIKIENRNIIRREELENNKTPVDNIYSSLKEGKIKSRAEFEKICVAVGLQPLNAVEGIRRRMKNEGVSGKVADFFTDDVFLLPPS